ncbi:MAG TPA: DUF2059 domain-containing protein, partial [Sphingomicrobium sp.]|nr:DUF2059 domain-containing protein [Sphingomicrobium sp.]
AFLLALALATAAPPSAEAQTLGRKLAEMGSLAALLPLMKEKETQELLQEDPALSTEEQAQLKLVAERVYQSGYERLMRATGEAYAQRLSIGELRSLVSFFGSSAAAKYREATPAVIADTMKAVGELDFKGDVRKDFCAQTKRLCPKE